MVRDGRNRPRDVSRHRRPGRHRAEPVHMRNRRPGFRGTTRILVRPKGIRSFFRLFASDYVVPRGQGQAAKCGNPPPSGSREPDLRCRPHRSSGQQHRVAQATAQRAMSGSGHPARVRASGRFGFTMTATEVTACSTRCASIRAIPELVVPRSAAGDPRLGTGAHKAGIVRATCAATSRKLREAPPAAAIGSGSRPSGAETGMFGIQLVKATGEFRRGHGPETAQTTHAEAVSIRVSTATVSPRPHPFGHIDLF